MVKRRCPLGCMLCYENRRCRRNNPGHVGYVVCRRKEVVVMALKRNAAVNGDAPHLWVDGSQMVCQLTKMFPTLAEFLVRDAWDPGQARERGTLLVCFGEGRWRAWLNDKDAGGLSAWLSGETLHGVLQACEKGLVAGSLEWRAPRLNGRRPSRA